MKLIRLKIGTKFRSLPENFEIIFRPRELDENEPICLVGLNGSGKSNVLEALAEIFTYMEMTFYNFVKGYSDTTLVNSFELEYLLPLTWGLNFIKYDGEITYDQKYIHIKITKESDYAPIFYLVQNNNAQIISADIGIIPQRIIGYSSGQNEIISISFNKSLFRYYHNVREELKYDENKFVEPTRLKYLNYEDSLGVLLSISLLGEDNDLVFFREKLGIEALKSFEILIHPFVKENNTIKIGSDLNKLISLLQVNATSQETLPLGGIKLLFEVTPALKKEFKSNFLTPSGFFNLLERLNLLNLNNIPNYRMDDLLKVGYDSFINYRINDYQPKKFIFRINEVMIKKEGVEQPIHYKHLSDGEHQFLYLIGTIIMFDEDVTLFLFDEPETNFNPKWKYEYVDIFKKIANPIRSQVLLTTHDPVLISGLKMENVIVFNKPNSSPRIFRPSKDLKGMGVDAILMSEIFGFNSTLDQETLNEIIERRKLLVKKEGGELTGDEDAQLDDLNNKLNDIDFYKPFEDPLYKDFVMAIDNLDDYKRTDLTDAEIKERTEIAKQIMERLNQRNP